MNKKIRNNIYIVVLAILCSLLIVSTFNVIGIINKRKEQERDIVYNYQRTGNIGYKVYLNKNDFIKENYLDQNQYYVSQFVNYIATTFDYKFIGDKNAKLDYSYNIKGILSGSYTDSTQNTNEAKIWTKEYSLKDLVNKTTNSEKLEINENLNINLVPYNLEVEKFKQILGIPITAKLTIQFNVTFVGTVDNKKFSDSDVIYMDIPLNTIVFAIDGPYNISSNGKILRDSILINVASNEMIVNGIISLLSLILIVIIVKSILTDANKTEYQLERERILNEYSNRIVIIKNFLDIPEGSYINVTTFNELIDLVDELNMPILCWIHQTINETWFIVINEKVVYRYKLKASK